MRQVGEELDPVADAQAFEPYGARLSSAGVNPTSYGYTEEWMDATGLVNLRARCYAPEDGLFVSKDPFGDTNREPGSLHPWSYFGSNPINFADPSGRWRLARGFELFPGGFYQLGRIRFDDALPCEDADRCLPGGLYSADMFIRPYGYDDVKYVYYSEIPLPGNLEILPRLLTAEEVAARAEELLASSMVRTPIGEETFLDLFLLCRLPDEDLISVAVPFISNQWSSLEQFHGYSNSFGKGAGPFQALAQASTVEQIPGEMCVTGVCSMPPCTYGEMAQTQVGSAVQAIAFLADMASAWSDRVFREFWVTIQRNNIEPSALRASILTFTKSGRYSRLWYDAGGWHEDPLPPGEHYLPNPTLQWSR